MKILKKFLLATTFLLLICNTTSFAKTNVTVNSGSAILVESSTGKILYEKNSKEKMYPASTTKILTGIIVIENCKLDEMVTVSESAISNIPSGYVTCNLVPGEIIAVKDLLYALMLPSANDAAYVLAEYVGKSIEGFSDIMNEKAKEIGCESTHFVNPNGIHDENHYSTAYDLYLIANYAMQNETFKEIVSNTKYTLPATNKYEAEDRILHTTNDLINPLSKNYYYEHAIGIKTGYTKEAGNCLVSESKKDDLSFISVVLKGGANSDGLNDRFVDTKNLFEYGYENFEFKDLITKNSIITSVEVENATKETKNLDLVISDTINSIFDKSISLENVKSEIKLNEKIEAPIKENTKLGTVTYIIDNEEFTRDLLAKNNVDKDISIYIILLILGFILLIISTRLKHKKRHRKK